MFVISLLGSTARTNRGSADALASLLPFPTSPMVQTVRNPRGTGPHMVSMRLRTYQRGILQRLRGITKSRDIHGTIRCRLSLIPQRTSAHRGELPFRGRARELHSERR